MKVPQQTESISQKKANQMTPIFKLAIFGLDHNFYATVF